MPPTPGQLPKRLEGIKFAETYIQHDRTYDLARWEHERKAERKRALDNLRGKPNDVWLLMEAADACYGTQGAPVFVRCVYVRACMCAVFVCVRVLAYSPLECESSCAFFRTAMSCSRTANSRASLHGAAQ